MRDRYFAFNKFDELKKYHKITPGKLIWEDLKHKYGERLLTKNNLEHLQNYVIHTMKLEETYKPEHRQHHLDILKEVNVTECKELLSNLIYDCDESCLLKLFGLLTKKFNIRKYDAYWYFVLDANGAIKKIEVPFQQSTVSVLKYWLDYLQIYQTSNMNNSKIELFYYNKNTKQNVLAPTYDCWQGKLAVDISKLQSGYQGIVDAQSGVSASYVTYHDSVWCDIRERSHETAISKRKKIKNLEVTDTKLCNIKNYLNNQYDNNTTHNGSMSCENLHAAIQKLWNKNGRKGFVKTFIQLVLFYINYNNKKFKWITGRPERFEKQFMPKTWIKFHKFQEMVYQSKKFTKEFNEYGMCFLNDKKTIEIELKEEARNFFAEYSIKPNESKLISWDNDADASKLNWFMYTTDTNEITMEHKSELCKFFGLKYPFWKIIKYAKRLGIAVASNVLTCNSNNNNSNNNNSNNQQRKPRNNNRT